MIERLDALIFDVDGTLAETEEAHRAAFNQAFAEAGLDWIWGQRLYGELLKVTGGKERLAHFIETVLPDPPRDSVALIKRLHARKTEIYTALIRPGAIDFRPGIADLIAEARRRGVALAIATTTSRPNVDALICAVLGEDALAWFASIACGDRVAAKKPAADVYELALKELDVQATRAIAIEDTWNGVRAARTAGLKVMAVPSLYSAGEDFSEADVVTTPEHLAEALGWA